MGLEIRKQSSKVWLHVPSDGSEFIFSKFYCKSVGEKFRVVEFGGSILKEYDVTEVSVFDIGGSAETFSTANDLMQRLEALGYNGFFTDGEVTPSTLISTDVDNALEVGTDNKLFVPQAGGVQSVTGSMVDNTDAENPIIQSDSTKENAITAGTTSQYFRGDKTFQTLDKTAVGLSNVDNTSDANKPISTAAQTALNNKLDKVTTVDVEKVYIKNADGTQGVKATSAFKDVLEFANLAAFPTTGETGKIYVALDTNFTYRWSGSAYVQVGGGGNNSPIFCLSKATESSVITGTTSEVIAETIILDRSIFVNNKVFTIFNRVKKIGSAGGFSIRYRINTTNSLIGSRQVAIATLPNGAFFSQAMERSVNIRTDLLEYIASNTSYGYENASTSSANQTMNIAGATNLYLFITVSLNSISDSLVNSNYIVTLYK